MSNEIVEKLESKKESILQEIRKLKRQVIVINDLIESEDPSKKITAKSSNKIYFENKIKEKLEFHSPVTKSLYGLVCNHDSSELNYKTFRSYLSQMKTKKYIYQDERRRWHLKIETPRE